MELSSGQQLQTCFVRENGSTDPSNAHEVGRRLTRNGERAILDCIQKPLALFFRESRSNFAIKAAKAPGCSFVVR